MTPDEVQTESASLVEETLIKVNSALVKGKRIFFQSNGSGDSDVPPGYMTSVKSFLEKAGWIVNVVGNDINYYIEVRSPKEVKSK